MRRKALVSLLILPLLGLGCSPTEGIGSIPNLIGRFTDALFPLEKLAFLPTGIADILAPQLKIMLPLLVVCLIGLYYSMIQSKENVESGSAGTPAWLALIFLVGFPLVFFVTFDIIGRALWWVRMMDIQRALRLELCLITIPLLGWQVPGLGFDMNIATLSASLLTVMVVTYGHAAWEIVLFGQTLLDIIKSVIFFGRMEPIQRDLVKWALWAAFGAIWKIGLDVIAIISHNEYGGIANTIFGVNLIFLIVTWGLVIYIVKFTFHDGEGQSKGGNSGGGKGWMIGDLFAAGAGVVGGAFLGRDGKDGKDHRLPPPPRQPRRGPRAILAKLVFRDLPPIEG